MGGIKNIQESIYPFWIVKFEKTLAIADDDLETLADLANTGSITQFKSPPNTRRFYI